MVLSIFILFFPSVHDALPSKSEKNPDDEKVNRVSWSE